MRSFVWQIASQNPRTTVVFQASRIFTMSLRRHPMKICRELIFCLILLGSFFANSSTATAAAEPANLPLFPRPTDSYNDQAISDLWQRLAGRVAAEPFNLVATVIFLLAIRHTFLASKFLSVAHDYEHRYDSLEKDEARLRRCDRAASKRDQLAQSDACRIFSPRRW